MAGAARQGPCGTHRVTEPESSSRAPRALEAPVDSWVGAATSDPDHGHESVLRRHGLIDCIAQLPTDLSQEDVARFRTEASRIARNVIPLAPHRFGLLLPETLPAALSTVPHRLQRDGARSDPPHDLAETRRDSHASADEQRMDASTSGPVPATIMDADAIAAAVEVRMEHLITRRLEAFERRIAGMAPARGALPQERVDAFWTGMEETLRLLGTLASRIETAATDARADAAATPPTAAEVGVLVELRDTITVGFAEASAARDAGQDALSKRLGVIETRLPALVAGLARIEERTQTADAAREAARARLDEVQRAHEALADQMTSLRESLQKVEHGVGHRLDTLEARLSERLDARDAHHAGATAELGEVLKQQVAETAACLSRNLDEVGTAIFDDWRALSEQVEAQSATLAKLGPALQALAEAAPDAEATVEPVLARIDALETRLADRGGVLSESVGTAQRSMKNFWLAAEDALRRIDESLGRLEGEESASADVAVRIGAATDRLDAVETHLQSMEQRQQTVDRGTAQLRHALAELLACQARAAAERRT